MLFSKVSTKNNTKDANSFAPSCSSADKNSNIVVLAGVAVAMSAFLFIISINVLSIIILLDIIRIICKNLNRKKQFIS